MPRDIRFFDKTREDMRYVGPGKYNVGDADGVNSKLSGAKCNAVFGRKPVNLDSRENAQEYVMLGQNVKHAPLYTNPSMSRQSLRKRAAHINRLNEEVTVADIFYANLDRISSTQARQNAAHMAQFTQLPYQINNRGTPSNQNIQQVNQMINDDSMDQIQELQENINTQSGDEQEGAQAKLYSNQPDIGQDDGGDRSAKAPTDLFYNRPVESQDQQ